MSSPSSPFALISAGSCPRPPVVTLWAVFERLADLESEFDALEARMGDIYASGDQEAVRTAGKRHAELKPIVDTFRELRTTRTQLDEAKEMLRTEGDAEMRELAREELERLSA